MIAWQHIPLRLLSDDVIVELPTQDGEPLKQQHIDHVRVELVQSATDDEHRSADAGHGTIYVDALMSEGAFEVPAGARVLWRGRSLWVRDVRAIRDAIGEVNHWELTVA